MSIQTGSATLIVLALATAAPASAGQHEEHQPPTAAVPCEQAAQQAAQTLDVLNTRLEAARQTNSPSQMRVAMDDLQATLGSMKAQLSGCAATASAAGTMPGMQHGAPGAADALRAGSATVSPTAQPATPAAELSSSAQSRAGSSAVTVPSRFDITLKTQPTPLKTGANQFEVTVKGADGSPITDVDVSVLFVMPPMPAMRMPEMRNEVTLKSAGGGKYVGDGQVMMAGQWNVTIVVKKNGKEIAEKKATLTSQ